MLMPKDLQLFGPITQRKTLSVMPTNRCPAECNHCGTLSSPRERGRLPLADIIRTIDEAADAGYSTVVFTGGEPTFIGRDLDRAIEQAVARGMSTRVVTNAHWAKTDQAADERIESFIASGLNEINYSTGDEHVRFVPLENILRAITAAVKANLHVSVMVELVARRSVTRESITEHPWYCALCTSYPKRKVDVQESPWMPLDPGKIHSYPEGMTINKGNVAARCGCDSVLSTTTLQSNGNLAACCGLGMKLLPELQLGNIASLTLGQADLEASADFLKRWIRAEGPEQILAWAAVHDPSIIWEDMYAHRCQACIRLYKDPAVRSVIADNFEEKIPDVLFSEWLLQHYGRESVAEADSPATIS